MTREELALAIYNISHLTGDFTLRSGLKSTEYFDKYRFEARPEILKHIAKHMKELIPPGTEVLAGLEMGGIPIATALSLETGLPCIFVRKEAKSYGTCQLAEGLDFTNKNLCIIEDVITTGGQVVESTMELRKLQGKVNNVLCVIYRGDGEPQKLNTIDLKMSALFNMVELTDR
ncbi:MAG: orotate phosphoribosyltransferase [Bdellovibrionales bacterium]|nr:orotate phosphoribosyltransferase [Bdellovibrionales bacterium]